MRLAAQTGIGGTFRFVRHRCNGLSGSGPDGSLTAADLFETGPRGELVRDCAGRLVPRHRDRVVEDLTVNNKWLKRGQAALLHRALSGHPGGPYAPAEINSPTVNPFLAFFVAADDSGGPAHPADALVTFDESDGQFDNKIPLGFSEGVGLGLRAILVSDTTGPGLKRNSIAYPTTAPYREIEYILFAQANVPVFATGSITTVAKSSLVDGETFTISDGVRSVTFEFDDNGSVGAGNVAIDLVPLTSADDVRDAIIAKINDQLDSKLKVTASSGGAALVSLESDIGGARGNVAIAETVADAGFIVTGMAGGSALEAGNAKEIDNLPIKTVGMSAGVDCSDGEANNKIGIRSIIGLAAGTVIHKRVLYHHEGASLTQYTGAALLVGEGYAESGHEQVTVLAIASDAGDAITAGNTVHMRNATFDESSKGRGLDIAGSGAGNNGLKTIATVIDKKTVTTVEALTPEGSGFTATEVEKHTGDLAFDGDVDAEAATGVVEPGKKWRSVDSTGPHTLARVFATGNQLDIDLIKIIGPAGVPKDNYPNDFTIQYLDVDKANTPGDPATLEPDNTTHWTTIDSPLSGQATAIFDAGPTGTFFIFSTPPPAGKCFGIRLTNMQAFDPTKSVEIAELYVGEFRLSATGLAFTASVDDRLRVSIDGGSTFRDFDMGTLSNTIDQATQLNRLNSRLRGWGLEAVALKGNEYIVLRRTVAGDNSELDIDSVANGSTANTPLNNLGAGGVSGLTGTTQEVIKEPQDALTIIYRAKIEGDQPTS